MAGGRWSGGSGYSRATPAGAVRGGWPAGRRQRGQRRGEVGYRLSGLSLRAGGNGGKTPLAVDGQWTSPSDQEWCGWLWAMKLGKRAQSGRRRYRSLGAGVGGAKVRSGSLWGEEVTETWGMVCTCYDQDWSLFWMLRGVFQQQ